MLTGQGRQRYDLELKWAGKVTLKNRLENKNLIAAMQKVF